MQPTIEQCQTDLHKLGWSVGDALIRTDDGLRWVVRCHRGEERVVAKASSQSDAWREARRMALPIAL